jgi:hypothetical protein
MISQLLNRIPLELSGSSLACDRKEEPDPKNHR